MARRKKTRRRGRPSSGTPAVSREAILGAALRLLESGGLEAVTMRALARHLAVDPMAAYHYFPDKETLLASAAESAYSNLRVRLPPEGDWRERLWALARGYVQFLSRSGELLRYVAARESVASASARHFDVLFSKAVESVPLDEHARRAACHAFVDLLHGHSLAGDIPEEALVAELGVLFAGIDALARKRR